MNLSVALRLGRISNLPTVWTNALVGSLLAGASLGDARLPLLLLALSMFYVGGMFLNDAFDRDFDARHRPDRPIPSGQVSAQQVFVAGFAMLALGLAGVAASSLAADGTPSWRALVAGTALGAAIVHYDAFHKNNAFGPLVMGLCRVLVYVTAAYAVAPALPPTVAVAAIALLCHLIGLTYAAKQEHLERIGSLWPLGLLALPVVYGGVLAWSLPLVGVPLVLYVATLAFALRLLQRRARGDTPRAIVTLIAAMSLLDAVVLAGHDRLLPAALAVAAFVLTLALQRWVSGT